MIEYLMLVLVMPFIDIHLTPLLLLLLGFIAERKGLNFSKYEILIYIITPIIPSIISGFQSYPFFLSYFMSILFSIKLASNSTYEEKTKELEKIMGRKKTKEIMFALSFTKVLEKKAKKIFLAHQLRGKINIIKLIISLVYFLNEKVKRKAITKALRE